MAEIVDEIWPPEIEDRWMQVVDAACKEMGWAPIWKQDNYGGWAAMLNGMPLTDEQWVRAVNLGRMAVGAEPVTVEEYNGG